MDNTSILGFTAGFLTTLAFLPQVIKTCKTKSTKDISLGMLSALTVGIVLWIIYGVINKDFPLVIANSITFILAMIILVYKLKYK